MAEETGIGWCDHTFNFWIGCDKVSEECRRCYIGPLIKRMGKEPFGGPVRTLDWLKPSKWHHKAGGAPNRRSLWPHSEENAAGEPCQHQRH